MNHLHTSCDFILENFDARKEARTNEALRKFVADVFAAQDAYYKAKSTRHSVNVELRLLTELYNEQELEQEMAKLKERQAVKRAAVQAKGAAKAKREAEAVEKGKKRARK